MFITADLAEVVWKTAIQSHPTSCARAGHDGSYKLPENVFADLRKMGAQNIIRKRFISFCNLLRSVPVLLFELNQSKLNETR